MEKYLVPKVVSTVFDKTSSCSRGNLPYNAPAKGALGPSLDVKLELGPYV